MYDGKSISHLESNCAIKADTEEKRKKEFSEMDCQRCSDIFHLRCQEVKGVKKSNKKF